MRYIDLFGGVGGFRLGIERATKGKWECVWYCDNDKYAVQTYNKNFGEDWSPTDIVKVQAESIPNMDVICAGFPCQSFSIAGKRKGFADTRGTLFFEICRIAEFHRPKLLFLENVKGLLSHNNGKTFATILRSLDELGYDVQWQVLDSRHFGIPQHRERIFIIGTLRGEARLQIFPFGGNDKKTAKVGTSVRTLTGGGHSGGLHSNSTGIVTRTIRAGGRGSLTNKHSWDLIYMGAIMSEKNSKWLDDDKQLSRNFPQGQRVYSADGVASTITGNAGGLGGKTGLYAIPVLTPDRAEKRQHGRRFKDDGEPSFTLTAQDKHGIFDRNIIRRLTPLECERLQGFPDNWTEGVSETQRYRQMGNAVTVNVIEAIVRKMEEVAQK